MTLEVRADSDGAGMLDWWFDQSGWIRYGIPVLLLAISTVLFFLGTLWPWGWAVGTILLLFAGPSDSEKKGYRF